MKKFSLYLITISFAMAACHSSKNTTVSNPGLKETYWKLTGLMAKPVSAMESNKEMHMILKNEDNRILGNAGCNTFTGSYELKAANGIAFSKIVSTQMACVDMEWRSNSSMYCQLQTAIILPAIHSN